MADNIIKLNKNDILRFKIETSDGKDTGEYLEFDLEDIELPLRYQQLLEDHKKNLGLLKNQMIIIDRRQDVKGKKLLSKNEEDKIKAMQEFYKEETKVFNMFLGENGVQKLLNGRKIGWTTFDEINDIIGKQIAPYIHTTMDDITEKVKKKYGEVSKKSNNVLKADDEDEKE